MSQARAISKGKALYDFAGKAEMRQLTFKAGDIINITNQYDNGWWAGELNGTVGYLPATYVQLLSAPAAAAPPPINGTNNGPGVPTRAGVSPGIAAAAAARAGAPNGSPAPSNRPSSAYSPNTNGSSVTPAAGASRVPPPAPSSTNRPGLPLASGGSGISLGGPAPLMSPGGGRPTSGYVGSPASPAQAPLTRPPPSVVSPPPTAGRPPLPAGGAPPPGVSRPAPSPVAAGRPAPSPAAAGRPPIGASAIAAAAIGVKPSGDTTMMRPPLASSDRGRAATLRPAASEVSNVTESDIVELDQLISKLQSDVSELKKLM